MSDLLSAVDKKTLVKYVQFSKQIIWTVMIAATIICASGMALCYVMDSADGVIQIVKAYCGYSMGAFACYSVNSISEKYIKSRTEPEETEDGGNG